MSNKESRTNKIMAHFMHENYDIANKVSNVEMEHVIMRFNTK